MKVFDAVGGQGLWSLLRTYGCPKMFVEMIEALYTGMVELEERVSITSLYHQLLVGCTTICAADQITIEIDVTHLYLLLNNINSTN